MFLVSRLNTGTGTFIRWYNDDTHRPARREQPAGISDHIFYFVSRVKQCHIISASSFSAWSTVARRKVLYEKRSWPSQFFTIHVPRYTRTVTRYQAGTTYGTCVCVACTSSRNSTNDKRTTQVASEQDTTQPNKTTDISWT